MAISVAAVEYEPKPCPFCTSQDLFNDDDGDNEWIVCRDCGARGPWRKSDEAAGHSVWTAWNLRDTK